MNVAEDICCIYYCHFHGITLHLSNIEVCKGRSFFFGYFDTAILSIRITVDLKTTLKGEFLFVNTSIT